MNAPQPLDFAKTWEAYAAYNMRERRTDEGEIAFWAQNATGYDAGNNAHPEAHQESLSAIRVLLRPTDTLLDVGAGSGCFTLPLAEHIQSVTALDLSPDMLALLRAKCRTQQVANVHVVESAWEDAAVEPHDVVLAAWSLYRQRDILASLQKLIDATKRTLIIIDGDYAPRPDDDPPHERLRANIWGADDPGICNYLYFTGMLRQLRVRADVRVVREVYTQTAESIEALARSYAPQSATAEEIAEYTRQLTPYVQQTAQGWVYSCQFAVGLVIWQREGARIHAT